MNKTYLIAAVIGVVVLGLGASLIAQNKPTTPSPSPTVESSPDTQTATPLSVTVALTAQNNSGETGTAILTALADGKTKVDLNLTGAPQDVNQPAHIHLGSCAKIGNVLFPLQSPVNGQSETLLDVSLQKDILDKLPLAINVHKSPGETSVYFSCGDIGVSANPSATSIRTPTSSPTNRPTSSPNDKRRGADKQED